VQGELESALGRLLGREISTVGAGRTDAGVHAIGQVASTADAPDDTDPVKVRDAVNAMCGPALTVRACREVATDFHARFSALSRSYIYAVLVSEVPDPWLARTTLWHPEPLDVDAMNEAVGHFVGHHDFSSFGRIPNPEASPERTLYELHCMRDDDVVRIWARANAFIHQMVRSLAGTLLQVGEGRRDPDDMVAALAAKDRAAAGPVAPPHGLCLVSVEYADGWSGTARLGTV
jgi:tRNA pseudouridine38-40 synthase